MKRRSTIIYSGDTHCNFCAEEIAALKKNTSGHILCPGCGQQCGEQPFSGDQSFIEADFWVWKLGQGINACQVFEARRKAKVWITERQLRFSIACQQLIMPSEVSLRSIRSAITELMHDFNLVQFELDLNEKSDDTKMVTMTPQKGDSAFWRYLANRFSACALADGELTFRWFCLVNNSTEFDGWMGAIPQQPDSDPRKSEKQKKRFVRLASRAVDRLRLSTRSEVGDLNTWLYLLRCQYGLQPDGATTDDERQTSKIIRGALTNVFSYSEQLCHSLATCEYVRPRHNVVNSQ